MWLSVPARRYSLGLRTSVLPDSTMDKKQDQDFDSEDPNVSTLNKTGPPKITPDCQPIH